MKSTTTYGLSVLTPEDLEKIRTECTMHHMAWTRGYVSRKLLGYYAAYQGKYGRGYVVFSPTEKSTRYCLKTYFIYK